MAAARAHQQAVAQRAAAGPVKGVPRPAPIKGVIRPASNTITAPGAAAPGTGGAPGGGGFVPDAQYLAEAAQRAFDRTSQINALNDQTTQDRSATDEAIRRLLGQVPQDRQNINQSANKEGLFYSGQLTKRLDDYEAAVARQRGDINTDFQNREDARAAARAAITNGAPLEEAAALAQAVPRQTARDTAAADAGALVAQPFSSGGGGGAATLTATQKLINSRGPVTQTIPVPGGVIKVHANGQRIFVPRRK